MQYNSTTTDHSKKNGKQETISNPAQIANEQISDLNFSRLAVQCKIAVGPINDPLESEADAMADKVMRMPENNFIQRKCSHCKEEEESLQRKPLSTFIQKKGNENGTMASEIISEQINSSNGNGNSMDDNTRHFMESRFDLGFGGVNIHTDNEAVAMNRELNAKAFTVGNDIYFNEGQYQPDAVSGKHLLAHELTHTIQQGGQDKTSTTPGIQREPDKKGSDYKIIRMHFDGKDLIVSGDGKEIFRYSGQSGRPVLLREEDAKQCGADPVTDTYMNDKRFVGIKDFGPIPEGTYNFSAGSIENFSFSEEMSLIWGGIKGNDTTKIGKTNIHSGDWGRGRVALNPRKIEKAPCGNSQTRDAFFLHGGLLAGSSGCIDIGGDFQALSEFLSSYKGGVIVTVKYEHDPPGVRFLTGFGGALAYKRFGFAHGPRLDIGYESGPAGNAGVASASYDVILKWAGGALSAGVHVDVPFGDREAFVRAGLRGGADFRIFQGLYGRLQGGAGVDKTEGGTNFIWEAGGGLKYEFKRVELEVIYNHIARAKDDHSVNQTLIGIGFKL